MIPSPLSHGGPKLLITRKIVKVGLVVELLMITRWERLKNSSFNFRVALKWINSTYCGVMEPGMKTLSCIGSEKELSRGYCVLLLCWVILCILRCSWNSNQGKILLPKAYQEGFFHHLCYCCVGWDIDKYLQYLYAVTLSF